MWFSPLPKGLQVTNFARAQYQGKPALVWWEGKIQQSGYGQGEAVLLNQDYREIARVRAAGGRSMDLHALTVTPQGTALFTCYPQTVPMDLSSIGAPRNSQVLESIIQEVDIASGRLLFEWRSLQHVPVSASEEPHAEPYDYLHINSIEQLPDGNLLVSGRHTWALYKLDRTTGKVIWTLGGKQSQLQMGPGAQFSWQHDARQHSDSLLTVFDNGTNGPIKTESESRGLVLEVDESHRRVTVRNSYTSPERLSAGAMGSVQFLSPDRVLVGWGVAVAHHRVRLGRQSAGRRCPPGGHVLISRALVSMAGHPSPSPRRRDGAGPTERRHGHVRQLERRDRGHRLAGRGRSQARRLAPAWDRAEPRLRDRHPALRRAPVRVGHGARPHRPAAPAQPGRQALAALSRSPVW